MEEQAAQQHDEQRPADDEAEPPDGEVDQVPWVKVIPRTQQ